MATFWKSCECKICGAEWVGEAGGTLDNPPVFPDLCAGCEEELREVVKEIAKKLTEKSKDGYTVTDYDVKTTMPHAIKVAGREFKLKEVYYDSVLNEEELKFEYVSDNSKIIIFYKKYDDKLLKTPRYFIVKK